MTSGIQKRFGPGWCDASYCALNIANPNVCEVLLRGAAGLTTSSSYRTEIRGVSAACILLQDCWLLQVVST